MNKLLFVGHAFHKKTRSSDFLVELLETQYEVSMRHVDPYSEDPYASLRGLEETHFDVLVCWQIKPPVTFINNHIHYRQGVFFPMYDACPSVSKIERWYPYRKFHIICFSLTLHRALQRAGFSSHGIQYFPEPAARFTPGRPDQVFFWNRREDINCDTLKQLFKNTPLKRLHIHKALDPNKTFIPPDEQLAEEITYSEWYPQKSDMLRDMSDCAIYIAPRKKEGIGMSFLEAMAMGRCVVAPDYPTMNEYITHGKNGLLYSLQKPEALPELSISEIQETTYQYMVDGRQSWETNKHNILQWLTQAVRVDRKKMFLRLVLRGMTRPFKITKTLLRSR
ncbi:MAG: glycosyltransferase [Akkermansiaceae bacterium]|nr:glycosyltransferase [Akkermansiaceae bacterium]